MTNRYYSKCTIDNYLGMLEDATANDDLVTARNIIGKLHDIYQLHLNGVADLDDPADLINDLVFYQGVINKSTADLVSADCNACKVNVNELLYEIARLRQENAKLDQRLSIYEQQQ